MKTNLHDKVIVKDIYLLHCYGCNKLGRNLYDVVYSHANGCTSREILCVICLEIAKIENTKMLNYNEGKDNE